MRVWLLAALVGCVAVAGFVVVTREEPSCSFSSWSYTFGGTADPTAEGAATTPEEALAWYLSQDDPHAGSGDPIPSDPRDYAKETSSGRLAFTADNVRLYPTDLGGVWAIGSGETIC